MLRRAQVRPEKIALSSANCGSGESLNWRTRCDSRAWASQTRCTELTLIPAPWPCEPSGLLSIRRRSRQGAVYHALRNLASQAWDARNNRNAV